MIIFKHANQLQQYLTAKAQNGPSIGFVPTMGALHSGHISLITAAKQTCDIVVSSVFVNPTQFNDPKDFEKYPVTIDQDVNKLEAAACDVLFLPSVIEMYPNGLRSYKHYDLGYLETILDGAYRPGHFQGVCQVVERLLEIVQPNRLFLGQKDYQQCLVLSKLIELMKINTQITIVPTQRETDGLAMSSRNLRLSPSAREKAPVIYQTLQWIKASIKAGDISLLKQQATDKLVNAGFKADYVELADASTLQLINKWDGQSKLVALTAAFIDDVRLIDNLLV